MRRNKMGNFKRVMAVMMLTCMLFTVGSVSSRTDHNYGIMPCGETIETEIIES